MQQACSLVLSNWIAGLFSFVFRSIPVMFFATVQRIDLRHLFLGQFKAEQIQILPDVIGIAGAGDHYDAPLQMPAAR